MASCARSSASTARPEPGRPASLAVKQLQAGLTFGKEGAKPGRFYDFEEVKKRTPDRGEDDLKTLNTFEPDAD